MRLLYPVLLLFFILLSLNSCEKLIQYHPNEVRLEESEKNLNAKNLTKLSQDPKKGSFRFIVIGDSQRFYDDLGDLVTAVNAQKDISFLLLNGDITDFGLNKEYKWINRELRKLTTPYLAVIGNHDMLANGRVLYHEMFGPEDFSFEYGDYKFVALNSNSREVGFNGTVPDTAWLKHELTLPDSSARKGTFVFSHVPPTSGDFDPRLAPAYASILSKAENVLYSVHAHVHSFGVTQPFGQPVNYLHLGSLNKRNFVIVNVSPDGTDIQQVFF